MSRNIVKPKSVSFEDALRDLASRLTGHPAAELPRTQEGVVQFMAENVPTFDEMAEAVTQEVFARLVKAEAEDPGSVVQQGPPNEGQQEAHNGPDAPGGAPPPGEGAGSDRSARAAHDKPKRGAKADKQ